MTETAKMVTWSQRVTLRMFADGDGHLDTKGYGIPGGTVRSLRKRGLIEPRSWLGPKTEWSLTQDGWRLAAELLDEDGDEA